MKEENLKNIISSLHDTDIVELTYEKGPFKLFFRRADTAVPGKKITKQELLSSPAETDMYPIQQKTTQQIRSTMVGTFHASPLADRPPLVIEGDHVMPGQKIGMIEAMKVLKDVISTLQGKVEKVLVQDGHAVEYGQPLFLIDTTDHNGGA